MMMSVKDNDSLFRELKDLEVKPSPLMWEKIEHRLDEKKKRRLIPIFLRVGVAASLALMFGLWWIGSHDIKRLNKNNIGTASTNDSTNSVDNVFISDGANRQSSKTESDSSSLLFHSTDEKILLVKDYPTQNNSETSDQMPSVLTSSTEVFSKAGDESTRHLLPANFKMASLSIRNINDISPVAVPHKLYVYSPPETASHDQPISSIEKKNTQVMIGGEFSPTYSFRTVSGLPSGNRENGLNTASGGLSLALAVGNRWQIETGVRYASMGQEVIAKATSEPVYTLAETSLFSENSTTSITQINLDNSLGKVSYSLSPVETSGLSGFKKAENEFIDLTSTTAERTENVILEQNLGYMQIPVTVRYQLFPDKKVGVSVAGGVSTNLLVNNRAFLQRLGEKQRIGETEGLNDMGFSTHVGVAFSVPLIKGLRFRLEPRMDYFISDIRKDAPGSYRPYSMGVFSGLFYTW